MTASPYAIVDGLGQRWLRFVDVDGIRTRYYEAGAGDPLVLFHGGQYGSLYSLDAWSLNLPGLAEHFHVYALDRLGQGHTDNPKTDTDYTFEALFEHTCGFFEALGISQANVAGHSRGAFLACYLALERPDLVKRLVLVDTITTAPEDPQYPSGNFYDEITRRTPPGPPTRETVRMEPDAQAYDPRHITDDFVDRLLEIARLPKTQEAQQRMKTLRDSVWLPSLNRKRQEALRRIDESGLAMPTLVIWGFNDRSAPLRFGLQLFERICAKTPEAELHVLNGGGHYAFREQYQAFNRVVRAFCG